jgi:hypothetical protein
MVLLYDNETWQGKLTIKAESISHLGPWLFMLHMCSPFPTSRKHLSILPGH